MSTDNILRVSDRIGTSDKSFKVDEKNFKTEILFGYDYYKDKRGISQLGEQIIEPQHNKITLGGILYILKSTFGVPSNKVKIKTLNQILGINMNGSPNPAAKSVIGFNIGLGGCGASYADEKIVLDQANIVPNIIPFRVVDSLDELGTTADKYWFRKVNSDGKYFCYIKTPETELEIHSLWKDSTEEGHDGNEVVDNPAESDRTEGIESFAELVFRISAKDLREYFELYDEAKYARFNSIGLCVGNIGHDLDTGDTELCNVIQFSVLNISNEMLHFDKDFTIIYRVFIS